MRLLAVLNVPSSTHARAKQRAPEHGVHVNALLDGVGQPIQLSVHFAVPSLCAAAQAQVQQPSCAQPVVPEHPMQVAPPVGTVGEAERARPVHQPWMERGRGPGVAVMNLVALDGFAPLACQLGREFVRDASARPPYLLDRLEHRHRVEDAEARLLAPVLNAERVVDPAPHHLVARA